MCAVLATNLPDRDPWPDPVTRSSAADPATGGGQFAFGRRIRAPGEADISPSPRTPPVETSPPAGTGRSRSARRQRIGAADEGPPGTGAARGRRTRVSPRGRVGSPRAGVGPEAGDRSFDPSSASTGGQASFGERGASAEADPEGDLESNPDDPTPSQPTQPLRRSLPPIGGAVRKPPSRQRRVSASAAPRPILRRSRVTRASRNSRAAKAFRPSRRARVPAQAAAGEDAGSGSDADPQPYASDVSGASGASMEGSPKRPKSQQRAPSSLRTAAGERRTALGLAAARRKSIAFALAAGADDEEAEWEILGNDGSGGGSGWAATADKQPGSEGRVRRGPSRGPLGGPNTGTAARRESPAPGISQPYQVMDMVRHRSTAAAVSIAADVDALAPGARQRMKTAGVLDSPFLDAYPEEGGAPVPRVLRRKTAGGAGQVPNEPRPDHDQDPLSALDSRGSNEQDEPPGSPKQPHEGFADETVSPQRQSGQRSMLLGGVSRQTELEGAEVDSGANEKSSAPSDLAVRPARATFWAGAHASAAQKGLYSGYRASEVLVAPTSADAAKVWLVPVLAPSVPELGSGLGSGLHLMGTAKESPRLPSREPTPRAALPLAGVQTSWGVRKSMAAYPRPALPPVPSQRQEGFDGAIVGATSLRGAGGGGLAASTRPPTGASAAGSPMGQTLSPDLSGFPGRAPAGPAIWRGRTKLATTPRAAALLPGGFALAGTGLGAANAVAE